MVKYAHDRKGQAYSFASALFYHHMYMYVCVCAIHGNELRKIVLRCM